MSIGVILRYFELLLFPFYFMVTLTSDLLARYQKSSFIFPNFLFCRVNPEKAMAPHSSTLAWKIPWTEEPGGPQSMGLLRVEHN